MLYFFYGSDTNMARAKAHEIIASLQKKMPGTEVFRIDSENWSEARLEEYIGGQGLFERKLIVFANRLFENAVAKEAVLSRLAALQKSENTFIFLEGAIDAETVRGIKKIAEQVEVIDKKDGKKEKFNVFSLADAFGKRDKKNLWVLYQQALASGAAPEEIHGILFWQLKNMFLALCCKSAEEANLKPFPWGKARAFVKNWNESELKNLSGRFVAVYHDSRRGQHDFATALERFILQL